MSKSPKDDSMEKGSEGTSNLFKCELSASESHSELSSYNYDVQRVLGHSHTVQYFDGESAS